MSYELWRANMQAATELYYQDYEEIASTKDSLDSKSLVNGLWKNRKCMGLTVCGPDGCGKHTTVAYFIDSIHKSSDNFQLLFLDGRELNGEPSDSKKLCEYLNSFLDDCYDGKEYSSDGKVNSVDESLDACIVFENPEQYAEWQKLQKFFYKTLSEYYRNKEYPRLFLVLVSAKKVELPALLQKKICALAVQLPNENRRTHFLEKTADYLFKYISKDKLVERTEGMTFWQIKNLVDNVSRVCTDLSKEGIEDFIDSQTPVPTFEEHRMRFEEKLPELLEKLAKSFSTMSIRNTAHSRETMAEKESSIIDIPLDEVSAAQKRRKELEEMAPSECIREVFGEERINKFLEKHANLENVNA